MCQVSSYISSQKMLGISAQVRLLAPSPSLTLHPVVQRGKASDAFVLHREDRLYETTPQVTESLRRCLHSTDVLFKFQESVNYNLRQAAVSRGSSHSIVIAMQVIAPTYTIRVTHGSAELESMTASSPSSPHWLLASRLAPAPYQRPASLRRAVEVLPPYQLRLV